MAFKAYPMISSKKFYENNYAKKEFFKTRFENNFINRDPEEVCKPTEFKLEKHQEFARNFISPETPYNGILLFYGTGVGKTCAAMSITEGLKSHISKMNKKIYIIAPESIQKNFMNELYSKKKADLEVARHSPAGSYQCVGNTYHISQNSIPDEEYRMKKIRANIKKHYDFFGTMEFANYIDIKLKKRQGMSMSQIAEKFADSIIVIDEAHNITGRGKIDSKVIPGNINDDVDDDSIPSSEEEENSDMYNIITAIKKKKNEISERSILAVLIDLVKECRAISRNIKIILLSATPMKDNYTELADLLELLNLNDGITINRKTLNPSEKIINYEYLAEISKGYISYVRGNDPVSFPKYVLPDHNIYSPNPMFFYNDKDNNDPTKNISDIYNIYLDQNKAHKYIFDLYSCPMSIYQFKIFIKIKQMILQKKLSEAIYINTKQMSTFTFPYAVDNLFDIIYSKVSPAEDYITKLYGNEGFKNCFIQKITKVGIEEDGLIKNKREIKYEYNRDILDKFGNFLMLKNNIYPDFSLSVFSPKFAKVIENINSIEGVCFCSNENEEGGAVLLALALESNGFIRYNQNIIYDKNGLPSNLAILKTSQMFSFKNPPNNFRCAICGLLYNDCIKTYTNKKMHQFKQATYIIKTGKIKNTDDIDNMTNIKNKYGHFVKVLIGTKVTNEGIDLKWIRQIHIISPWYNNTKIYQIIGRGIRYCSHIDLMPENRNVCVYKYTAGIPNVDIFLNNDRYNIYDIIKDHSILNRYTLNYDDEVSMYYEKYDTSYKLTELTLRNLLTETTDELIYGITVLKDIQVKKLERVLKTVAVDCELNKNINYNKYTDKDYSRECEFQKCKYSCSGYSHPIEYFSIALDIIKQKIKCPNIFNNSQWHSYVKEDNYLNISKVYTYLGLPPEIRISITKLAEVLVSKGASINAGQYYYSAPKISIDISTYNIHFAQPQINKAIQYIAQLFQHNIALKEKNIIDLITHKDSLIDVEFIRSALDQIVGNPPNILPKEIKDKFNRPGILIYVNTYYVFQPNIFSNDKKIPLFYRGMPITYKPEYVSINNTQSAISINKKPEVVNMNIIDNLYNYISVILDAKYSKNMGINTLIQIAKIRYKLDFNTLLIQEYFFKKIISDYYDNKDNVTLGYMSKILIEYYLDMNLIIIIKEVIYSFMNPTQIYTYEEKTKRWNKIFIEDNDEIIQLYNKKRLLAVNNSGAGMYGFIAESNSKTPRSKIINTYITNSYNRTIETLERMLSYMQTDDSILDLKFKINDKSSETQLITHLGKPSKKTYKIGLNCMQNATTAAKTMLVKLKVLFSDIFKEPIKYKNEVIDDSIFKPLKLLSICEQIALSLKILDIVKYKNVRWFLSPYDTEYFIPIKYNLDII